MRKQRLRSTCKPEHKPKRNHGSLLLSRQLSIVPGHPQYCVYCADLPAQEL
jgi:hypothetical protein